MYLKHFWHLQQETGCKNPALQLFSCFHNRCHCDIMVFWIIRWFQKLWSNLLCVCPQMAVLNSCGCCRDLQREMHCSLGTSLTWNSESIDLAQDLSYPTFLNLWLFTFLPNFSIPSEHFLVPSTEPNAVSTFICSTYNIFLIFRTTITQRTRYLKDVEAIPIHLKYLHRTGKNFIPLARAECDDSMPFSGTSSIPPCYVLFPATLLHQLFVHPLSLHLVIYFLVYLSILLFQNSYIILFWEFYILSFSVHAQTNVIYLTLLSLL